MKNKLLLLSICLFVLLIDLKAQELVLQLPDSKGLVDSLARSTCDYLKESIKKGEITEEKLFENCITHLLTDDNFTTIKNLSGDYSIDSDIPTSEHIDKGFRKVLRACLDNCPAVDTFFNYDGHQRPAYAHLSSGICNCILEKESRFKDPDLAKIKYPYLRDSCVKQIFSDPAFLNIVHSANTFETKADVDAYDRNLGGYYIKKCSAAFEFVINRIKIYVTKAKASMVNKAQKTNSLYEQDRVVNYVLSHVSSIFSSDLSGSTSDYFKNPKAYQTALPVLNSTKVKLKNYKVLDYIPNKTHRTDGIIEHRLTMYHYNPKAKKRTIICQLVIEFEEKTTLVAAFRYIAPEQIANLEALQKMINKP